jgi:hypothetical protein
MLFDKLWQRHVVSEPATPGYRLRVDLPGQIIVTPDGSAIRFAVDAFRKHCLVDGLDGGNDDFSAVGATFKRPCIGPALRPCFGDRKFEPPP